MPLPIPIILAAAAAAARGGAAIAGRGAAASARGSSAARAAQTKKPTTAELMKRAKAARDASARGGRGAAASARGSASARSNAAKTRAAAAKKRKKVPVSKSKIEMKGKPTAKAVPYSSKIKKMGSEGPKISRRKKIAYGSLAGAGALGAAASRLQVSVKPPVQTKSGSKPKKGDTKTLGGRKAVYNGTNWVPAKK